MRINPKSDEEVNPLEFCRDKEIVGVGHEIYIDRTYDTLEELKEAHREYEKEHYENRTRFKQDGDFSAELRYILKDIDEGDYIWVNRSNDFYLCRAKGEWDVAANQAKEEQEEYISNDIHNLHRAEWQKIPFSSVPGFVQRQFSGQFGTIAKMRDPINDTTRAMVEKLFKNGELTGEIPLSEVKKHVQEIPPQDVFDALGPTTTEDLVLLYLQSEGWKVIGSSLSSSQAEIECELVRSNESAVVQIKSGNSSVTPSDFEKYTDNSTVFFFVGDEKDLDSYDNIKQIAPANVTNYLVKNIKEAPRPILSEIQQIALKY